VSSNAVARIANRTWSVRRPRLTATSRSLPALGGSRIRRIPVLDRVAAWSVECMSMSMLALNRAPAPARAATVIPRPCRFAAARWRRSILLIVSLASGSCSPASDGGANAAQGTVVSVAVLAGSVPACAPEYAHPNVCCQSAVGQATVCTESLTAPFTPCNSSVALTYPDPRTCCPLDGDGTCLDADAGAEATAGTTTSASCALPCSVGLLLPSGDTPNCADDLNPGCALCCDFDTCPIYGICSCPNEVAGSPPCQCAGIPTCGPCPSGWQARLGIPDLCYRVTDAGATECFSQAGSIAPIQAEVVFGGEQFFADGGTSCGVAARTANGDGEEVSCNSTESPACICTKDGVVVQTLATSPGCPGAPPVPPFDTAALPTSISMQNADVAAMMSACGFSM